MKGLAAFVIVSIVVISVAVGVQVDFAAFAFAVMIVANLAITATAGAETICVDGVVATVADIVVVIAITITGTVACTLRRHKTDLTVNNSCVIHLCITTSRTKWWPMDIVREREKENKDTITTTKTWKSACAFSAPPRTRLGLCAFLMATTRWSNECHI